LWFPAPICSAGHLDRFSIDQEVAPTVSMAKHWVTDLENQIVDECLQLFGYGYMSEYPISPMYRDSRVQRARAL
jgi:alkylation response protein AidB-like acyl-CoA dehydrogenase